MGQSTGLEASYFRPNEKQLLTEYLKAVNELTINEENRLKKKVTPSTNWLSIKIVHSHLMYRDWLRIQILSEPKIIFRIRT